MTPSNSSLSRILIPASLLLAIIIAVVLFFTKPQAKTALTLETARPVEVLSAQPGAFRPTVPVFVKVTTPNHANLRASVTADVKRLITLQGTSVNKGDELVLLDDREALLAVKQRQADVQEVRSQIDAEDLKHKNAIYVIANDKGKRAIHNREQIIKGHEIRLSGLQAKRLHATTALQLAQLDLERTRIIAPFSGQVTQVHVATGDRVRVGDKIIDLYDHSTMELTGSIPQRYIQLLQKALNQQTVLHAHGLLNEHSIQAQLSRLSAEVSVRSGGIDAIFAINKGAEHLQLGRSLKMYLELQVVENAFVLPDTALYGSSTIYKIEKQRLKAVTVSRLGDFNPTTSQRQILVTSQEIKAEDVILITQLPNAIENLLVTIVNDDQ